DLELGFLCPVVVVPGLLRTHPARGTHAPPRGHPHTALPPAPTRAAAVFRARPHRHRALRRPRATSHPTGGHPQPAHPTTGPRLLGDQQVRGVRGVERPPTGPCLRGQFPSRFHLRLVQRTPGRQTVPLLRKQRHTHHTFPPGHTTPRTHAFGSFPLRQDAPAGRTRCPAGRAPGPRFTVFALQHPGHVVGPIHHERAPTPEHQRSGTAHGQRRRPSPTPHPHPRARQQTRPERGQPPHERAPPHSPAPRPPRAPRPRPPPHPRH